MSGHFVAMTVNCESWRGGMGFVVVVVMNK